MYQAHELLWKTDITGAEKVIQEKQAEYYAEKKTNLWLDLTSVEIAFWKISLEGDSSENKKQLEKQLEKLEKLADWLTEEHNPDSIGTRVGNFFSSKTADNVKYLQFLDGLVVISFWHFIMALWNFRLEERVKGAYHFQRCWSKLSESMELLKRIEKLSIKVDPAILGMIDFGVGLYHFVISLIPPSLQIITTIAGFEADREKAIEELNRCISSGCVWAPIAMMFLVVMKHFFLDEKEDAVKLLDKIKESYPKAATTCYFSGFMGKMNGELVNAIGYFREVEKMVPNNEKMILSMNYQIGYTFFLLNDWENVIVHFEKFLQGPVKEDIDKALRPYASYILGFSYWITSPNDPENKKITIEKIVKLYISAKEWVRPDESFDKYAKRKMSEFIQKKCFDEFDELFVPAEASREGKQFQKCLEILEKMSLLLEKPENSTKREYFGIYNYLKGSCLKGVKNYEEGAQTLRKAIAENGKITKETWIVPLSWLVLAEMTMEQKQWTEASSYFDKLKDFKDYDWDKIAAVRIYGSKQTLEKYLKQKK